MASSRTARKRLDIADCFRRIRQDDDIQRINYFTTIVEDPDGRSASRHTSSP